MTSDEAIDWADRLRDWLPATPGDVLALGPGTGGLALLAADQGHRVTEVLVGDTDRPPGRGRRFDVVLAHDALGTTADPEAALRRWRGLLRPGGRLVLVAGARGTGSPVALPVSRLVAALTPLVARLHSERLSGDARLSGAPAEDERYALVGVVPDAPARHTEVVDVHLILRRGDEVLLARRAGTGYGDGLLHLPSGHVEDGEDVRAAVIREAREELGLDLAPADLRMEAVVQHRGPGEAPRIGWFFSAEHGAGGEPVNAEPDKCAELVWHPLSALPHDMVAYCRAGLAAWRAGERFIVHWQSDEEAVAYEGERTTAPESLAPVRTGGVHHVELWVPDLEAAEVSWGWLLGELGHVPFQRWGHGRSWRRDEAYVVLEQSPDLRPGGHDRHRPGLNHLAFHVAGRAVLDRLVAAAPDHGWALLFADRHPHAGGEGRYAAYLEDAWGYEVELVAE
ncbi:trifunctional class I SAM-dependent methyltransferase/NUDIX hydrolase/VOC family protein [Streptomyces sp. KL118A]|uniref:trifunctional class I SAM-dependent methyltransferase/NUDIX hydrolase/VOC family protein n=1 Tax=Streptomyces sp. KL118A TaxID=3045153 RepID=UPI00278C6028|nr:NUDIX domain-containing protein [Streptomyces sp. KL118A]